MLPIAPESSHFHSRSFSFSVKIKNPCIKRLIFAEHSRESPLKVE